MKKRVFWLMLCFLLFLSSSSLGKVVGEYPKKGKVINSWEGELFPLVNGSYWIYIENSVEQDGEVKDSSIHKVMVLTPSSYEYYEKVKNYSKKMLFETIKTKLPKKVNFLQQLKREQLLSILLYLHDPLPESKYYLLENFIGPGSNLGKLGTIEVHLSREIRKENGWLYLREYRLILGKIEKDWVNLGKYLPISQIKLGESWINAENEADDNKVCTFLKYEVIGTDLTSIGKDKFISYVIGKYPLYKKEDGTFEKTSPIPFLPAGKIWIAPDIGIVKHVTEDDRYWVGEILIEYYRPDKNFWWYTSEKIVPDIPEWVEGADRRPWPRLTD